MSTAQSPVAGPRRRGSLAVRMSALSAAAAIITAIVAGVLSLNLVRSANEHSARRTLAKLADAAVVSTDRSANSRAAQVKVKKTLQALKVSVATIDPDGAFVRGDPLAGSAVTPGEAQRVLDTGRLSLERQVANGRTLFVEARGTRLGGIVLAQRRSDALADSNEAVRRIIIALLVGVLIAVALGLIVAWRMALPLRRTAQAAHALADGHRDVQIPVQGPAEVAEVGAAVNALAAALTVSEQRQRDFLLSVSHDLRTPLTAISGYAESLADGTVPSADTAYVGAVMLGESRRLNRLVGDLLDLARLDAQDFRIDAVPTDLVSVSHAAAQVWHRRCSEAEVRFVLEVPDGPVVAVTDALRLRQVADGLLENALRVTPAAAPIVLAVRQEPAAVVLEVRDGRAGAERRRPGRGVPAVGVVRAIPRRAQGRNRLGTGHRAAFGDAVGRNG